jgi:methylase of polypeptide subunit release factors
MNYRPSDEDLHEYLHHLIRRLDEKFFDPVGDFHKIVKSINLHQYEDLDYNSFKEFNFKNILKEISRLKSFENIARRDLETTIEGVEKRVSSVPIEYVVNRCDLKGVGFYIDQRVQIPSIEDEWIFDEAVKLIRETGATKLLSVKTGIGNLALSIRQEIGEGLKVEGIDTDSEAIEIAKRNGKKYSDVDFNCSNNCSNYLKNKSSNPDIIVANMLPSQKENLMLYKDLFFLLKKINSTVIFGTREMSYHAVDSILPRDYKLVQIPYEKKMIGMKFNGEKNIKEHKGNVSIAYRKR